MARLTASDIDKINEVYKRVGTYAATARETGFSAASVKKYVVEGDAQEKQSFSGTIPAAASIERDSNWGTWLCLSDEEVAAIEELRKEMER